jgi:cytochrome c oxidase subunit II
VPGRLAQLWFAAEKEGIFFGQCSEICGKSHAYMPITVKVVNQETYDAWLKQAKSGVVQLSADMLQMQTVVASN